MRRLRLTICGQVQGVGFRPFIWRIANETGLHGFVRNTSAGVRIEVQGPPHAINAFTQKLKHDLPPLAKITSISQENLPVIENLSNFIIKDSEGHASQNVLVSPDVATCPDCLDDIADPQNRRFGYAFTNCVNCGPRYTITKSIPYDRASTTMACFSLCENCNAEYLDPADRRFHAQPIACPACGPKLWFYQNKINIFKKPLEEAARALKAGQIIAIKGLGGFQLACDATNSKAVNLLRQRKKRTRKALAIMTGSLENTFKIASPSDEHIKLLTGQQKPIVLCSQKQESPLAQEIAPDSDMVGIMLPYTPLHALLFAEPDAPDWLVMTSANPKDEPICLGNREAIERLENLADGWLLHDRDILTRVDDSVVAIQPLKLNSVAGTPLYMRRARGYVPSPISLPDMESAPVILGTGAELKATFCLTRSNQAFVSQHIGDLKNPASLEFYKNTLERLQELLEVTPDIIIHDLHPDFLSSRLATELSQKNNIPAFSLQHHAAHAASVLAENQCYEPALAICLDGTGLGDDNSIWGGEMLYMELKKNHWRREASFSAFPLPGGEAAINEPWRIAQGLAWQNGLTLYTTSEAKIINQILDRGLNCPPCSSCGRLFDAIAALLGICQKISYEGEAAIRLEQAALNWIKKNPDKQTKFLRNESFIKDNKIDSSKIFARVYALVKEGRDIEELAVAFHYALSHNLVDLASQISQRLNLSKIGLSGGVFHNRIMGQLMPELIIANGISPLIHKNLPPGDGGLSFGQAVWGRQLLKKSGQEAQKIF